MEGFEIIVTIVISLITGLLANFLSEPIKKFFAQRIESKRIARIAELERKIKAVGVLTEDGNKLITRYFLDLFNILRHILFAAILGLFSIQNSLFNDSFITSEIKDSHYYFSLAVFSLSCFYFSYVAGFSFAKYKFALSMLHADDSIELYNEEISELKTSTVESNT